jgi:hypothetical protein
MALTVLTTLRSINLVITPTLALKIVLAVLTDLVIMVTLQLSPTLRH